MEMRPKKQRRYARRVADRAGCNEAAVYKVLRGERKGVSDELASRIEQVARIVAREDEMPRHERVALSAEIVALQAFQALKECRGSLGDNYELYRARILAGISDMEAALRQELGV